jgi:YegS/Rv2252/BmrU family lipid kinase
MTRKFICLINPIAGTKKKDAVTRHIQEFFTARKLYFLFEHTDPSGKYASVKEKISKENITDIIIVGGDGSVNQAVHALHQMPVRFGIIPQGSGNGLAFAAGIPKNPVKALEIIMSGHTSKTDAFSVNHHFACMLSGIGLDAQVAHDFAGQKKRGLTTYISQTLQNFIKAKTYRFEIHTGGQSFVTDAFFISVANGNQFGNNFTIAPSAILNDGLLDIVIVRKMNKLKLPAAVFKQLRSKNNLPEIVVGSPQKDIIYFQTPSLVIKNPDAAPLHIDGEPMSTLPELKFSIQRNCFELLQPVK